MQFPTPSYIRSFHFKPSKKHGQNFLVDKNIAEKTIAAASLSAHEVVVEIGPGLGSLTLLLHSRAITAYCYELDKRLYEILSSSLPQPSTVRIEHKDILTVSLSTVAARHGSVVLLESIPYSLTTPILLKFLEESSSLARAVFIVQKEVAERLCACPGSKTYGILSVYCAAYATPTLLFSIPPSCFYPVPEVDSAAIMLVPRRDHYWHDAYEVFFRMVVRRAFGHRRKILANTLKSIVKTHRLDQQIISRVCSETGIDIQRRPETLSVDEWYRLASFLQSHLHADG